MTTVESFSICLDGFDQLLRAEHPAAFAEARILRELATPARLLRWAIVKVDKEGSSQRFWCEGAYLKNG